MLPAALSQITLALGGRVWQAWLAAFLCLTTPIFIAQIGLVQTDLPLTALLAMAWWSLLVNQRILFCLFAALAVWTKETGYFLAVPAAILLWWQAATTPDPRRVARSSVRSLLGVALSAWPALTPPLALSLWLLIRRIIKGNWMESDHVHALSLISPAAHYHNWLDAGRFGLSLALESQRLQHGIGLGWVFHLIINRRKLGQPDLQLRLLVGVKARAHGPCGLVAFAARTRNRAGAGNAQIIAETGNAAFAMPGQRHHGDGPVLVCAHLVHFTAHIERHAEARHQRFGAFCVRLIDFQTAVAPGDRLDRHDLRSGR
jgi:4-amino-4-deoxy-L-arabinose transferase-like glycosyltransferase